MPKSLKKPFGFFVPALILGGAILLFGHAASAADTQGLPESSSLNLRPPDQHAKSLAPATTGQWVETAAPRLPQRMSLGINDLGAQLRLHLNPDWAAEVRFLMGSASSDFGTVHANVFGMRGYRFFTERRRWRLYAGLEGDYVKTSLGPVNTTGNPNSVANVSGFGSTSGYALGGFGGFEFRLMKRVAFDLDIGPYMIGLHEKVTHVSDASLDFVANTAINVYIF